MRIQIRIDGWPLELMSSLRTIFRTTPSDVEEERARLAVEFLAPIHFPAVTDEMRGQDRAPEAKPPAKRIFVFERSYFFRRRQ
jgi:hypothetical protein